MFYLKICPVRKDLKIILMSATFCIEAFTKYFNNCPVIEVHGTLHHVHENYLEDIIEEIKYKDFPDPVNYRKVDAVSRLCCILFSW